MTVVLIPLPGLTIYFPFLHAYLLFASLTLTLLCLPPLSSALELKFLLSMPLTATGGVGIWSESIVQIMQFVVDDVNEEVAIPAGHNVSVAIRSSEYSSAEIVRNVFEAAQMGALAVIGERKCRPTTILTMMAQKFGMYTCSGTVTSKELSDRSKYPRFIRTIPSDDRYSVAMAHFIKHQGWSVCSVLASASAHGRSTSATFLKVAKDIGIQVATAQYIHLHYARSQGYGLTNPLAFHAVADSGTRLVLYFGDVNEYLAMAPLAKKIGIIGPQWVWIASESVQGIADAIANNSTYFDLSDGMLYLTPREFLDKKKTKSLLRRIQQIEPMRTELEPFSGFIRDCVFSLTHMFVEAIKSPEYSVQDIMERKADLDLKTLLKPFSGITGTVYSNDQDHKRHAEYWVMNLYRGQSQRVFQVNTAGKIIKNDVDITYFSGSNVRPPDRPDELIMFLRFGTIGAWALMVMVATTMGLVFVSTAVIIHHRNSMFVKEARLSVLIPLAFGLWLMLGSTVFWIDVQSSRKCVASLWSTSVGFQLVLIPLLHRSYSTWIVLNNSIAQRNRQKKDFREILVFVSMFLVHIITLFLWTWLAPLNAKPVTTRTSFSYQCQSDDTVLHSLFEWVLVSWNVVLLLVLLYFTTIARNLKSIARVPRYAFFVASNLALCIAVLSPLYIHHFPEFALGSFWVHVAVTLFACLFTLGMTHIRVIQLIFKPEPDPYCVTSDWTMMSIPGMPNANVFINQTLQDHDDMRSSKSNSVAVFRDLVPVSGRTRSWNGDFAIKKPGLLSTWRIHRILIAQEEHLFGITPMPNNHANAGELFSLKSIHVNLSKSQDMVIDVYCDKILQFVIQFRTNEQVANFLKMVAD